MMWMASVSDDLLTFLTVLTLSKAAENFVICHRWFQMIVIRQIKSRSNRVKIKWCKCPSANRQDKLYLVLFSSHYAKIMFFRDRIFACLTFACGTSTCSLTPVPYLLVVKCLLDQSLLRPLLAKSFACSFLSLWLLFACETFACGHPY